MRVTRGAPPVTGEGRGKQLSLDEFVPQDRNVTRCKARGEKASAKTLGEMTQRFDRESLVIRLTVIERGRKEDVVGVGKYINNIIKEI